MVCPPHFYRGGNPTFEAGFLKTHFVCRDCGAEKTTRESVPFNGNYEARQAIREATYRNTQGRRVLAEEWVH